MSKCLCIHGSSEHGNDLIAENQVHYTKQYAADNYHDYRITDALLGDFRLFSSKTQTYEGTAAIANHDSNRQCNNRKRENHRIGSIAI